MRSNIDSKRIGFPLLVLAMLGIAVGHLYVLDRFTDLTLGLPAWLWMQLGIVALLFILAWLATDIATPAGGR